MHANCKDLSMENRGLKTESKRVCQPARLLFDSAAFTLAELLVVVAIVAVLVAVAIPLFTGGLEKAKEATCSANLTSSRHGLVVAYLANGGSLADDAINSFMTSAMGATASEGGYTGLCPDDGKYTVTVEGDRIEVACSKHGASPLDVVGREESLQALLKLATDEYFGKGKVGSLDSTGTNFGSGIRKNLGDQLGIPENSFDFRIWKKDASGGYKVYIFDNLAETGVEAGKSVVATCYTYDSSMKLTNRETGSAPVVSKTVENKTFLVLDAEKFKTI